MKSSFSSPLRLTPLLAPVVLVVAACSSSNSAPLAGGDGGASAASCDSAPALGKNDYCKTCTMAANAVPNTCRAPRVVNACCTYVQPPSGELVRGTGLNRNSSSSPTINLACLDNPGDVGTPQTVKLKGFVRVFSSGSDSAGVKIEVFKEGPNGTLGEIVGTPVVTTKDDT